MASSGGDGGSGGSYPQAGWMNDTANDNHPWIARHILFQVIATCV